ncbi:hypothetical protein [Catellatospora citrea]|uniref:Class 3 adenylate cyclase n=1 Tax=Catellatospora citrea TaxID=53366 RepID=A0A8J3K572_9ACTN|nr:hypothetical protein [Catellatospora citrea]RKE11182.1 hypothetical protein C8E86_6106 [Catellatospora citrea]GIF96647.1 hypothetical protein Cci01nite_17410 [Catellatospora citrea]
MSPAVRQLCLFADIEGYSRHRAPEQVEAQHRLLQVMWYACSTAGVRIHPSHRQDQGDGQLLLLQPGVDEATVIAGLITGLRDALYEVNRNIGWGRLRLRAALSQGAIQVGATGYIGVAVVAASRLLDSPDLRTALAKSRHTDLALIVTDDLYQDVIRQGHSGLDAARFQRVQVANRKKAFRATGWVHVAPPPAENPNVLLPHIERDGRPWRTGMLGVAVTGGAGLLVGGAVAGYELGAFDGDPLPAVADHHGALGQDLYGYDPDGFDDVDGLPEVPHHPDAGWGDPGGWDDGHHDSWSADHI